MRKLTPKQERFCLEYIKTGFGSKAYINAGYSATNKIVAEANARRLLGKDYIKKRVQELMEEVKSEKIADAKEVMEYLTRVMRKEEEEEVVIVESVGDFKSKAKIIKKKPSLKDANKAAELLGKRYRIFTEKLDVNANVNQTVQFVDDLDELEE